MSETADRSAGPRRKAPRRAHRRGAVDHGPTADDLAWRRAANEVAAALLAKHFHARREGHPQARDFLAAVHDRIADAKLELGAHPDDEVSCLCRHKAIISVGSYAEARMTGVHPAVLFDGTHAVLCSYLAARS